MFLSSFQDTFDFLTVSDDKLGWHFSINRRFLTEGPLFESKEGQIEFMVSMECLLCCNDIGSTSSVFMVGEDSCCKCSSVDEFIGCMNNRAQRNRGTVKQRN